MELLDERQVKMLHNLMRERGVDKVNLTMFNDLQKKFVYEGYGEKFLAYNGMWFMMNAVMSYALAKNLKEVNNKLKKEMDYGFTAHDYDYAMLCARLMKDETMVEFLKNYTTLDKYEKVYAELVQFTDYARSGEEQK